jgi:hypothetical protein
VPGVRGELFGRRVRVLASLADVLLEVKILTEQRREDADVRGDVLPALQLDSRVPTGVDATVRDGFVTLTAGVDWQCRRDEANFVAPLVDDQPVHRYASEYPQEVSDVHRGDLRPGRVGRSGSACRAASSNQRPGAGTVSSTGTVPFVAATARIASTAVARACSSASRVRKA